MKVKDIKEYILRELTEAIKHRDASRGSGVLLAENIGSYYMQVGEILALQRLCDYLGVGADLVNYDPFETEEDYDQFNYCGALGEIGRKNGESFNERNNN